ncbi:MAG: hypothetical protein ACOYLO_00110 [Ferruginibacter sp.]
MKVFNITGIILISILGGCAKQQCPKIPETVCGQCAMQVGEEAKEVSISTIDYASAGVDITLDFLKKSEKYLSEKIEGWKVNHPELVDDGKSALEALRLKITEYERRAKDALLRQGNDFH